MTKNTRNIGIDVKAPEKECNDKNCPFHGSLKVRGKSFLGDVVKDKMYNGATVEWYGTRYISKYERYEKIKTKIHAHNPPCISAKIGDKVRVMECRPLSKTKNFVIIEKISE